MNYVLVENKTTVLLGPTSWKPRFIQSELNDLEVNYTISPAEPNGYLKINDQLEIYPVQLADPIFDPVFDEPAGPFWSFDNEIAIGNYNIVGRNIDSIKNSLKVVAAAERYRRECAGTQITINNITVSLSTDRDGRKTFQGLTTETTIAFKFSEGFIDITQADINNINATISNYVQQQFDWEKTIVDQIDNSTTREELQIVMNNIIPTQNNNSPT